MTVIGWFLLAIGGAILFFIADLLRGRIGDKLYEEGRTRQERERALRLRDRAFLPLILASLLLYGSSTWPRFRLLEYATWPLLALAFFFVLKASQRTSALKTGFALLAIVGGFALLMWGLAHRLLPGVPGGRLGLPGAAIIIVAATSFVVASRLSRAPAQERRGSI